MRISRWYLWATPVTSIFQCIGHLPASVVRTHRHWSIFSPSLLLSQLNKDHAKRYTGFPFTEWKWENISQFRSARNEHSDEIRLSLCSWSSRKEMHSGCTELAQLPGIPLQHPAQPAIRGWSIPPPPGCSRQCRRRQTRLSYDKLGHLSHETCRNENFVKHVDHDQNTRGCNPSASPSRLMNAYPMNFERCTGKRSWSEVGAGMEEHILLRDITRSMPWQNGHFMQWNGLIGWTMFLAGQNCPGADVRKAPAILRVNRAGLLSNRSEWSVTVLN